MNGWYSYADHFYFFFSHNNNSQDPPPQDNQDRAQLLASFLNEPHSQGQLRTNPRTVIANPMTDFWADEAGDDGDTKNIALERPFNEPGSTEV